METPAMLSPTLDAQRRASIQKGKSSTKSFHFLLKAHYFLFFSAFGILYPILNVTLRARGLSDWELSLANVIIPFLVFFTNPLLGYLADRTGRYLTTFSCVFALATITYTVIFLLPPIQTNHVKGSLVKDSNANRHLEFCAQPDVVTVCASRSQCGCVYQAICKPSKSNEIRFNFSMNAQVIDGQTSDTCGNNYRVPVEDILKNKYSGQRFHKRPPGTIATCDITCSNPESCRGSRKMNQLAYIFIYSLLFILGNNFLSNAIPLGASIGFATLEDPGTFGYQRVFGTIGFGISSYLASLVYSYFLNEYVYIIMFAIVTVLCIIATILIPLRKQDKSVGDVDDEAPKTEQSLLSQLSPLLKKVDVIIFLLLTFLWGMPYAGLDPYLYLYVDEIAPCKSRSIIGYMSSASAVAEIAGFFLAKKVLNFLGTNRASVVILLAFAVRFAGYHYITVPEALAVMESMHFFNFGILYVLIVQKADSIAPPGLAGTLQGVALGITFGLGRGIGLVLASFIYSAYDKRTLFLVIAIFNLIAAILFSIYFLITRKKVPPKNRKADIENDTKLREEPLLEVPNANEQ